MCSEIKTLVKELSCYFSYILEVDYQEDRYNITKIDNGETKLLFSGSERGCIDYLKRLKIQVYDYHTSKCQSKGLLWW